MFNIYLHKFCIGSGGAWEKGVRRLLAGLGCRLHGDPRLPSDLFVSMPVHYRLERFPHLVQTTVAA